MTGGRYELTQKGTVLILKVKDLEKSDSEVYTCDIGSAKSTAKLMVKGKIYCKLPSKGGHVLTGTITIYTCMLH